MPPEDESTDFETVARFEHLEGFAHLTKVAPRMAVARNGDGLTVLSMFTEGGAIVAQVLLSTEDSADLRDVLYDEPDLVRFAMPNGSEAVLDPAAVLLLVGGPDSHTKIGLTSGAELMVTDGIEQVIQALRG